MKFLNILYMYSYKINRSGYTVQDSLYYAKVTNDPQISEANNNEDLILIHATYPLFVLGDSYPRGLLHFCVSCNKHWLLLLLHIFSRMYS